ncbi:hypothetical protein [Salaquimonas pukyongi]|uniref:hypothetical protein n=1 Tax=Salaquimonas pukyongi TaxID=2712698 RepID=UPI0012EC4EF5|nr:hypothetical protein [Salaquimonas pukyongi]
MHYYNDAVMMAYRLGIWDRIPHHGGKDEAQRRKLQNAGPFRLRAARPAGDKAET